MFHINHKSFLSLKHTNCVFVKFINKYISIFSHYELNWVPFLRTHFLSRQTQCSLAAAEVAAEQQQQQQTGKSARRCHTQIQFNAKL